MLCMQVVLDREVDDEVGEDGAFVAGGGEEEEVEEEEAAAAAEEEEEEDTWGSAEALAEKEKMGGMTRTGAHLPCWYKRTC